MTNLALLALAMTLAAEPSATATTEATATPPAAEKAVSGEAEAQTSEATPAPAENPPAPAETAPAAAPAEAASGEPAPAEAAQPAASPEAAATVEEAPAEDPTAAWYSDENPSRLRILALPVARTVAAKGIEFVIDHRSTAPIYNKDSDHAFADMWNNFGGLDQALSVGLGLRYGIIDRLDAGLYRVGGSQFDTYEIDVRVSALRQEENQVDLMVRGGLSWFSVPKHEDALWPFAQIFASRLFVNRLLITAGVMYHSNSSSANALSSAYYTPKYRDGDHKWSVAGAGGIEVRLADWVALDAETVACAAGYCNKNPAFSAGVKFFSFRHTFSLVCGNTQYLTSDGYITNTDTPWSKLVLGFNLTREY